MTRTAPHGVARPTARGRPKANVDGKRASIVAAARSVFSEHGLEAASMRLIAREAGVAAATLYLYFKGVEELYGAVLSESLGELGAAMRGAAAGGRTPALAARRAARAFFDFYLERPNDAALGLYLYRGLEPRGLNPAIDDRLNHELIDAVAPLTTTLAQHHGLARGVAALEAFNVIAGCLGLAILHHTGRTRVMKVDAHQACERLLDRLI